jgi:hypothetical protein
MGEMMKGTKRRRTVYLGTERVVTEPFRDQQE